MAWTRRNWLTAIIPSLFAPFFGKAFAAAPATYPSGSQEITPVNGQVAISAGPQISQFQMVAGTFTANGATAVTVVAPLVNVTSIIDISLNTVGGTVGAAPVVKTLTAGTGFTVAATAGDTSVYNYLLIG